MHPVPLHALLRDRRHWLGTITGFVPDRDGALQLVRVPGPTDGRAVEIAAVYPYERRASGLAAGPCETLFVADTEHDRVLFVDGTCGEEVWLPATAPAAGGTPGSFRSPRGLAVGPEVLWVADSGNARLQALAFPGLEPSLEEFSPEAVSIASDSRGRLVVADAITRRIRRRLPDGQGDTAFDAAVAASGRLKRPGFVAIGSDDQVLVSDVEADAVLVFDADGNFQQVLSGPAGWRPGALATQGGRVYVADAADGAIRIFDGGTLQGDVAGWRGPVTALAVHPSGDLLIKPGLDGRYYRFAGAAASVAFGSFEAGPFDAGEDCAWERICVAAELTSDAALLVEVALDAAAASAPATWHALPSPDALLSLLSAAGRRFAWIRIRATAGAGGSPVLRQVRLATAAEDYLDYLPMTYRRHGGENGFLSRWLKLLRSEFSAVEEAIDDMPRLVDPTQAPASALSWLAQWLAFELPSIADDDERRALIARAVRLFARRGTGPSIAEFVELHTGIRPIIAEGFSSRRIWILDGHSRLGFDTRLPPLDPQGFVVPDEAAEPACCPGPIGRVTVGAGGPLAAHETGRPLFAEEAYRFCVLVDAYRITSPDLLREMCRIVDREKPAHTDYRVEMIAPELRIGLQATIGLDTIVGGEPPGTGLGRGRLSRDARLAPPDVARAGQVTLEGGFTLA